MRNHRLWLWSNATIQMPDPQIGDKRRTVVLRRAAIDHRDDDGRYFLLQANTTKTKTWHCRTSQQNRRRGQTEGHTRHIRTFMSMSSSDQHHRHHQRRRRRITLETMVMAMKVTMLRVVDENGIIAPIEKDAGETPKKCCRRYCAWKLNVVIAARRAVQWRL